MLQLAHNFCFLAQGYSKNQKKVLRDKSKVYRVSGADLLHAGKNGYRILVESADQRKILIRSTHEGLDGSVESAALGGHLGRDSTTSKIVLKYYW